MGSTLTVDNIVGATTSSNVKLPAGSCRSSLYNNTTQTTRGGQTMTNVVW